MTASPRHSRPWLLAAAALLLSGAVVSAASLSQTYEPKVGQSGKDVVWVPSPQALVDKMLDMAQLRPDDYLVDLGSGDGRTVITAAKRGARAMGVEFNPDMVALSKRNAEQAGVTAKATFVEGDIFKTDFSQATVLTLFLLPDLNVRLRPTILAMRPGTRVVSNSFTMGEWTPDETFQVTAGCISWCTAHLWIVPARVEGRWQMGNETLTLSQDFQMLAGSLGAVPISEGRIRGDEVSFSAGGSHFRGRVSGTSVQGTVSGGRSGTWTAARR